MLWLNLLAIQFLLLKETNVIRPTAQYMDFVSIVFYPEFSYTYATGYVKRIIIDNKYHSKFNDGG